MSERRLHNLAKELGMTSKDLLELAKSGGVAVEYTGDILTPELEQQIKDVINPPVEKEGDIFPAFGVVKHKGQWGIVEYKINGADLYKVELVKFHTTDISRKADAVVRLPGIIEKSRIKKKEN